MNDRLQLLQRWLEINTLSYFDVKFYQYSVLKIYFFNQ